MHSTKHRPPPQKILGLNAVSFTMHTVQFVHCTSLWVYIYLIVLTFDCENEKTKEVNSAFDKSVVLQVSPSVFIVSSVTQGQWAF